MVKRDLPIFAPRRAQRGAMLITASLVMFLLLGFIGVALDFGRLFVIKTELQTAMDSCALAAAQELDAQADAIMRAQNAGKSASDLNRVDFQSPSWGGLGLLDQTTEITFRDSNFNVTTTPGAAVYAQCQHTHTGAPSWLIQALGAFGGNSALATNTHNVYASAIATRGSAQSTCPLPIALRPQDPARCYQGNCGAPNYGYAKGEWITLLTKTPDNGAPGYIGWANLDGTNSASETVSEMNGHCGVSVGTPLGTPGVQQTISDNWNWRFGIYKNQQFPSDPNRQPDRTGYGYTDRNWPAPTGCGSPCIRNAYDGPTPAGAPAGAENFVTQRAARANCIVSTTVGSTSVTTCRNLLFPPSTPPANLGKDLITGGLSSTSGHALYGTNRRIAIIPMTNTYPNGTVQDFVCMLMLEPMRTPLDDVHLEFIGNAAELGSPCSMSGLPGGVAGPLVPVLVR